MTTTINEAQAQALAKLFDEEIADAETLELDNEYAVSGTTGSLVRATWDEKNWLLGTDGRIIEL